MRCVHGCLCAHTLFTAEPHRLGSASGSLNLLLLGSPNGSLLDASVLLLTSGAQGALSPCLKVMEALLDGAFARGVPHTAGTVEAHVAVLALAAAAIDNRRALHATA